MANKPINQENARIVVDCIDTKRKVIEIGWRKNETIKEVITRLVEKEYKTIKSEAIK